MKCDLLFSAWSVVLLCVGLQIQLNSVGYGWLLHCEIEDDGLSFVILGTSSPQERSRGGRKSTPASVPLQTYIQMLFMESH